jgi:hypothetical protein
MAQNLLCWATISKAFDRVWHKGLLRKLESIGIRGSLLSWVSNYLSERKQPCRN